MSLKCRDLVYLKIKNQKGYDYSLVLEDPWVQTPIPHTRAHTCTKEAAQKKAEGNNLVVENLPNIKRKETKLSTRHGHQARKPV